jgi:hypothetical protein
MDLSVGLPQEALDIVHGATPEIGTRNDHLLKVGYSAAEAGLSNDQILALLDHLCDHWGLHSGRFARWARLLGMLRRFRAKFPNSPDGSGYRAGDGD